MYQFDIDSRYKEVYAAARVLDEEKLKNYQQCQWIDAHSEFRDNYGLYRTPAETLAREGKHEAVVLLRKYEAQPCFITRGYAIVNNDDEVEKYINLDRASSEFAVQGYAIAGETAKVNATRTRFPFVSNLTIVAGYTMGKHYDKAIALCQQLNAPELYNTLANILARCGKHDELRDFIRKHPNLDLDDIVEGYRAGGYYTDDDNVQATADVYRESKNLLRSHSDEFEDESTDDASNGSANANDHNDDSLVDAHRERFGSPDNLAQVSDDENHLVDLGKQDTSPRVSRS